MRLVFSDEAEADLEDLGDYIAQDNPARAVSFLQELRTACVGLGQAPLRFARLEGFEERGWRRRIHGSYAIIYHVGEQQITIIRVVSLAMDIGTALGN